MLSVGTWATSSLSSHTRDGHTTMKRGELWWPKSRFPMTVGCKQLTFLTLASWSIGFDRALSTQVSILVFKEIASQNSSMATLLWFFGISLPHTVFWTICVEGFYLIAGFWVSAGFLRMAWALDRFRMTQTIHRIYTCGILECIDQSAFWGNRM